MTALQTSPRAEVPAPPAPDQPLPDPGPVVPVPDGPDAPQPDPKGPETRYRFVFAEAAGSAGCAPTFSP